MSIHKFPVSILCFFFRNESFGFTYNILKLKKEEALGVFGKMVDEEGTTPLDETRAPWLTDGNAI